MRFLESAIVSQAALESHLTAYAKAGDLLFTEDTVGRSRVFCRYTHKVLLVSVVVPDGHLVVRQRPTLWDYFVGDISRQVRRITDVCYDYLGAYAGQPWPIVV